MLARNGRDKSFSCLSKRHTAVPKKSFDLLHVFSSVLCIIQANVIPHYLETEKGRMMGKTSLGQALSTQAGFFCRCWSRLALDPDIKGLRESFPPFKEWAYVSALAALIFATSLPATLSNDTLFKCKRPLVSQFLRIVGSTTPQPSLSHPSQYNFWIHFAPVFRCCQVSLVLSCCSQY